MDEEVQRAYRTLQRAGINTFSPYSTIEELVKNYGLLIYKWLVQQGITIDLIKTSTQNFAAATTAHFKGLRYCSGGPVTTYCYELTPLSETATDEEIQSAYWSQIAPPTIKHLINRLEDDQGTYLSISGTGWARSAEKKVVVYYYPEGATQAFIYYYRPYTEKEQAAHKARAEKAVTAAETRRKRKEARDKAQLKKLLQQYGPDVE